MKVRFTPRARRRAKLVAAWWAENRTAAPDAFYDELQSAISALASRPGVGSIYMQSKSGPVRRLLMPKTEQYVYYVVDVEMKVVVVHTIWGARRERGPKLAR